MLVGHLMLGGKADGAARQATSARLGLLLNGVYEQVELG